MNVNGLTNTAPIAQANLQVESESPSSGSLSAELTGTRQAATSQSLDTGASDDWAKIRGEFAPPDFLMESWSRYILVDTEDDTGFGKDVKSCQDSLAKSNKEPTLVTTALAAHINQLGVDSCLHALTLLLNLNDDAEGVTFDRNKLETLAASRWIECFPEDEKDQVLPLIQFSLSTD